MNWGLLRIAAAIMAFSGVVAGFIVNIDRATREGEDLGAVLANYFNLFTIVTALLSVIALVAAAIWSMRRPGTSPEPLWIALGIAGVSSPVFLLGIVYNALLRGGPSGTALGDSAGIALLDTWAIEVLHVVMPIYFLVDLLFAPRRRALPWWTLAVMIAYPLIWLANTMIRGELVANPDGSNPWWYPYPFLDPHNSGGYGSAFAYIGVMIVAFLAIGALIIWVGHYRAKRAARRASAGPMAGAVPA